MKLLTKYKISLAFAALWFFVSLYFGLPWISEIAIYFGSFLAWFIVTGIAFIPGIVLAFVNMSLILDRRPEPKPLTNIPDISILIAAYNEESTIKNTLLSILHQKYDANVQIIVINDASTDKTSEEIQQVIDERKWRKKTLHNKYRDNMTITVIDCEKNGGKAAALNRGLKLVKNNYVITLDADSRLYEDALINIVTNIENKSEHYAAVAGTILSENALKSLITRMQQWDYLHGIASVKRIQSMYNGTLVAQGAFSIYKKSALDKCGGWPDKIGEDIVMTWGFHNLNYKIGYAEDAICFTNVPETYMAFFRQRKRWARGLIEALKKYPKLLFKKRMSTPFIWYNLVFPYIDIVFLFVFIPGVIAAVLLHWYVLASIITLFLLPLAFIGNAIIYIIQRRTLRKLNIEIYTKNWIGFIFYMLFFQLIMTPATLIGYFSEFLKTKRVW